MCNCAAFKCKNRGRKNVPGITFHRFPKNVEMCNAWVQNMQLVNWTPTQNDKLCSVHFEVKCFYKTAKKTRLLKTAVPTVFPNLPTYLHLQRAIASRSNSSKRASTCLENKISLSFESSTTTAVNPLSQKEFYKDRKPQYLAMSKKLQSKLNAVVDSTKQSRKITESDRNFEIEDYRSESTLDAGLVKTQESDSLEIDIKPIKLENDPDTYDLCDIKPEIIDPEFASFDIYKQRLVDIIKIEHSYSAYRDSQFIKQEELHTSIDIKPKLDDDILLANGTYTNFHSPQEVQIDCFKGTN